MARRAARRWDEERTKLLGQNELFVQEGKGGERYFYARLQEPEVESCPLCSGKAIKMRDLLYHPDSRRAEEITAMKMFNYCKNGDRYDYIGKIIDYQTPLKNISSDEAGKIDLLAYDGTCLRLLELKKPVTKETMLRCLMEGFTDLETVDQKKLLQNFDLPPDTIIAACPLVFAGEKSNPYQEMQEERPQLRRLMDLLNSKPYYIMQVNDTFTVTEG